MKKFDLVLKTIHYLAIPTTIIILTYIFSWDIYMLVDSHYWKCAEHIFMNIITLLFIIWWFLGFAINVFIVSGIKYLREKRKSK